MPLAEQEQHRKAYTQTYNEGPPFAESVEMSPRVITGGSMLPGPADKVVEGTNAYVPDGLYPSNPAFEPKN